MRRLIATIITAALAGSAQQAVPPPQQPPASDDVNAFPASAGTVKFDTTVQLVVVEATVKDKKGKPIEGLTDKDFIITEDGKPQTIKLFKFQQLENEPLPVPALAPRPAEDKPKDAEGTKPLVATQIAPARPGEVKYQDKRLLALYFDMSGMGIQDQIRAQEAAIKFLKEQMTPSDLISIMSFSNDLKTLCDFTNDRDQLIDIVKKLNAADNTDVATTTGTDTDEDTGAAFTADDTEFTIFNTDRKMLAIESAVKMLGQLNEKKALVYFSAGVQRTGSDNDAQLRSTINAAVKNNVAIWTVDASGLSAEAPMGNASTRGQGSGAMLSGRSAGGRQSSRQGGQDTLFALAEDTGGKALENTNDLAMGIKQAQQEFSSYYIVGYYSTNPKLDGKYRRIKLTLAPNLLANVGKVDYRSGYFAGKEFKKFTSGDKEKQLAEALVLGDPFTDLTVALEVNYFRRNRDNYYVPVTIKIPGTEFELAKHGDAESTKVDWIGEVRDAKGAIQANVRDESEIKLKGETMGQLAKKSIAYNTGFTLAPGSYTLKVLARENISGKMGTFEHKFVVPNLEADNTRLPISAVVLSNQRENLTSAVFNAERRRQLFMADPLVQENKRLIPSVTRVFRKDQEMYVYLEAYEPTAESTQPVVAQVSFYRGKVKAFETEPLQVTDGLNMAKAVPLRFSFPLEKLEPGRYECQVSVLDPTAGKFNFWRAPIVVLPTAAATANGGN